MSRLTRMQAKTWEKAMHARQRARQTKVGFMPVREPRPAPEIKALPDHQFDRALRWFRSNAADLGVPPAHILGMVRAQKDHLKDEVTALNAAHVARQAQKRKKRPARKVTLTPEQQARQQRQKLNGTKKRQDIVATMSNWQRSQWAKAGYPADKETFERYAAAAIRRVDGTYLNLADGKTYRQSDGAAA